MKLIPKKKQQITETQKDRKEEKNKQGRTGNGSFAVQQGNYFQEASSNSFFLNLPMN